MNQLRHIAVFVLLCLAAESSLAAAGRFLTVVGEVQLRSADGEMRSVRRNEEINRGDMVITGRRGYAQLRMSDHALISVRPGTEFKLDDYEFENERPSTGRMLVNLLRGSSRSLTGLIGSRNRRGYAVRTPHATIGIRGTDHETHVTLKPQDGFPAGTFDVVFAGGTTMTTSAGVVNVAPRQAAFVSAAGQVPRVVPIPRFLQPVAVAPSATTTPRASARVREGADEAKAGAGNAVGNAAGGAKGNARIDAPADAAATSRGDTKSLGRALRPALSRQRPGPDTDEAPATAKSARPLLINPLVTPGRATTLVPGRTATTLAPALSPKVGALPTLTPSIGTTKALAPSLGTSLGPTLDSSSRRTLDSTATTGITSKLPTTTLISPTLSTTTTKTLDPTLSTTITKSPTLISPTLSTTTTTKTLDPALSTTIISPTTTTISPTLSTTTTKTLDPALSTTISPTTTILKSPTTTLRR